MKRISLSKSSINKWFAIQFKGPKTSILEKFEKGKIYFCFRIVVNELGGGGTIAKYSFT
jgi:hypothetical protein